MANRRFEMFQYRQVLTHMRSGQSDSQIAKAGLMGRVKVSRFRDLAAKQGWLDLRKPLPDDDTLAAVVKRRPERETSTSILSPYYAEIKAWHKQGVAGTTIHDALVRKYYFPGSYSAVRRCLQRLKADETGI
jgi:hypothetical protein